jgi:hypothetical protein
VKDPSMQEKEIDSFSLFIYTISSFERNSISSAVTTAKASFFRGKIEFITAGIGQTQQGTFH